MTKILVIFAILCLVERCFSESNPNVLFILGHPDETKKSFNHRLSNETVLFLEEKEIPVRFVDLYSIGFDKISGPKDFIVRKNEEKFDYQLEQSNAVKENFEPFADDVKEQISNILWADVVIFQFPLYWFNEPSIIANYIEKIFAYHFAYGSRGSSLVGKKTMWSITTGGPSSEHGGMYNEKGMKDFMYSFKYSLEFVGMRVLKPFYCFGANTYSIEVGIAGPAFNRPGEEEHKNWIEKFQSHILKELKL